MDDVDCNDGAGRHEVFTFSILPRCESRRSPLILCASLIDKNPERFVRHHLNG